MLFRTDATVDRELAEANQRMAERLCRVGSPRGQGGTIEYVYRSRQRPGALIARDLMDTGGLRRIDILDVYVFWQGLDAEAGRNTRALTLNCGRDLPPRSEMLTRDEELTAAAERLEFLGMPRSIARRTVLDVLELPNWEAALALADSGALHYPDTWLTLGAQRFQDAVRTYLETLPGGTEGRPIPSILDIFVAAPPLDATELVGLGKDELIRRMARAYSPYLLMPAAAPGAAKIGTRRTLQKVVDGRLFQSEIVRVALPSGARIRADLWWITGADDAGDVAGASGVLFTPMDRAGIAGEKALLSVEHASREMFSDLLSIAGSVPGGHLAEPVSSIDYVYVAPRARGHRVSDAMCELAIAQIQRASPRFGNFVVDPYPALRSMQFPDGVVAPSVEDLRHHFDHRYLMPIGRVLRARNVGLRMRAPRVSLQDEQSLYLVGALLRGEKLQDIRIPSEADLIAARRASPLQIESNYKRTN